MTNAWKLWGVLGATAAAFGVLACSGESSNPSNGGTGGAGTGGGAGAGNGSGGANAGTGGDGQGTGGAGNEVVRGPHTELFDCSAAEGTVPGLAFEPFLSGLDAPTFIKPVPGTTNRFVVGELFGRIRLVVDGVIQEDDFVDLSDRIERGPLMGLGGDERGLFDLAFHPDFETNGLFYVHHTAAAGIDDDISVGDTVVAEYQMSDDDSGLADANSMRVVYHTDQPQQNHNGGGLAFGGDGLLYIAVGDGGGGDDLTGQGQNVTTPLGAILRIDVDGRGAGQYSLPAGNLVDLVANADPVIWSYGLRNPYRISVDGCNGDLYIADVGQSDWEEVNVAPPGEGQKNYGWRYMEGDRCRGASGPPSTPEACLGGETPAVPLSLPAVTYANTAGSSVTGGYVYRGSSIPALRGAYFYADLGSGRIWTFRWNGTEATEVTERTVAIFGSDEGPPDITSFGQDANGEIYLVRVGIPGSPGTGTVLRLVAE